MKKWIDKYQGLMSLILFFAAVIGWFIDSQVNRKVTSIKVDSNSENIEWIVETLLENKEVTGKIIMYIELEKDLEIDD